MSRGLIYKSVREAAIPTMILAVALGLFETLLAAVLPTLMEDFSGQLLQIPFIRTMISALLGMDLGDVLGPDVVSAFAWVHPVALAIVWTQAIIFCTRVPAGEIDRGTIDLLLSLPVSRWRVYATEAVVFLAAGGAVLAVGLSGHGIGILSLDPGERPTLGALMPVLVNLFALYLAVGGLACLVSALSDRRGHAVGIIFAILLASFVLNFLAQFWQPAQAVAFLGLLNYYQPLAVLRVQDGAAFGGWPVGDLAVLVTFAAVTWTAGGVWLARRDICTV